MEYLSEFAYVIGAILVAIYAAKEFNGPEYYFYDKNADELPGLSGQNKYAKQAAPSLPKYMTEATHYRGFTFAFMLSSVLVYILLANLLPVIPGVNAFIHDAEGNAEARQATLAMLSALLLLGIVHFIEWPKVLVFGLIKNWFHDFACIPTMGREIFTTLAYDGLDLDAKHYQRRIEALMQKNYLGIDSEPRQDLTESDFCIGNTNLLTWKWARLSYCIHIIEEWEQDPIFSIPLRENSLKWKDLRALYVETITDVMQHKSNQLGDEETNKLKDKIELLLANSYRLMACAIIMIMKPHEDPLLYVQNLGYKVTPGSQYFAKRGEAVRSILVMLPAIILFSLLYTILGGHDSSEFISKTLVYIQSAFFIFGLPIIAVLALKRHLSLKRSWRVVTKNTAYDSFFDMPYILYSAIALGTWAASTLMMMLIINKDGIVNSSIADWHMMGIYCFISAITAFITAYRVDTPPLIYPDRLSLVLGRSKLAFIQGGLTATTVWVGMVLFPTDTEGALWKFPLMAFVIAAVICYTMFYGKHSYERRNKDDRVEMYQPIQAVIDNATIDATLVNQSETGACVRTLSRRAPAKGSEIELILESGKTMAGTIVNVKPNQLNIRFIDSEAA